MLLNVNFVCVPFMLSFIFKFPNFRFDRNNYERLIRPFTLSLTESSISSPTTVQRKPNGLTCYLVQFLYITISSLFSRIFLCFFCKISIFICPKNHSCSWKWRENCRKDFNLEEKTTEISCLSLILFWYVPLKGSKLNKNIIRYSFSHIQQESFLSIYLSIYLSEFSLR